MMAAAAITLSQTRMAEGSRGIHYFLIDICRRRTDSIVWCSSTTTTIKVCRSLNTHNAMANLHHWLLLDSERERGGRAFSSLWLYNKYTHERECKGEVEETWKRRDMSVEETGSKHHSRRVGRK